MFEPQDDIRSDEAEEALGIVAAAAESLETALRGISDMDAPCTDQTLLAIHAQFEHTNVALEASAVSTVRDVVRRIVAVLARILSAVVDFFRAEYHSASRCINAANKIIENASRIAENQYPKRDVTNMAVMMAISYDGHYSRYLTRELDAFYARITRLQNTAPYKEARALIGAIRGRDARDIEARQQQLHAQLEHGLKTLGPQITRGSSPIFSTCDPGLGVYASERMFGDRIIFGQISQIQDGSFHYSCMVRRDPSVRMRVKSFPVIRPNDISLTARTVRAFCEDFLRKSDVERELMAIDREAKMLTSIYNDGNAGVKELRTIINSFQNPYVVSTRHAMYVTRNIINYLVDCVRAY